MSGEAYFVNQKLILGSGSRLSFISTNDEEWKQYGEYTSTIKQNKLIS